MERHNYQPEPAIAGMDELPFVLHQKRGRNKVWSNWHVEPATDYGEACLKGTEYAIHFLQFIVDNPSYLGFNAIGMFAQDMDFTDQTASKGYYVGFFSTLEKFLHAGAKNVDLWKYLDERREGHCQFKEKCRKEEAEKALQ